MDAWAREVGLRHSSCEAGDKVEQSATDSGEPRRRPRGMRASKARAEPRAGQACHRR
jgi:hypothetical protein